MRLSDFFRLPFLNDGEVGSSAIVIKKATKVGAPVAVIFSSVNSNGFSYFKLFERFEGAITRIYVRDPSDMWYNNGVSENLNDSDKLFQYLHKTIRELKPSRVMCFGSSMGGYAALRFAMSGHVDLCVSTSPQTILDTRLPHTPKEPVDAGGYDLRQDIEALDHRKFLLFFGAADFVDVFNVLRVHWAGATVYPIANRDHLVAEYLYREGVFDHVLKSFIAGESAIGEAISSVLPALDNRVFDPPTFEAISRIVESYYLAADWDLAQLAVGLIEKDTWADAEHILSQYYRKKQNFGAAVDMANRAFKSAPASVKMAEALASTLRSAGRLDEAVEAYERCLEIRPKQYSALCALAELLAEKGEKAPSLRLLLKAQEIRPRLSRAFDLQKKLHQS
ncbi:tetratricopeptide repeat protein [Rhizobium rhizophilum]|nr:tetratricopeptide repeat protein [Rhizobium rhizophilum]